MLDRRTVLASSAMALGADLLSAPPATAEAQAAPPVTQILARYIVNARFEDLPAAVRNQRRAS